MTNQKDPQTLAQPRRSRGRPAKYLSAAEKQKAYRERLKAKGMGELRRIVKKVVDPREPVTSKLIDLSVLPAWKRA